MARAPGTCLDAGGYDDDRRGDDRDPCGALPMRPIHAGRRREGRHVLVRQRPARRAGAIREAGWRRARVLVDGDRDRGGVTRLVAWRCDRELSQARFKVRAMEARIVTFPTSHPGVRVAGDRIEVDRVTVHDGPLAAWLAAQPTDDHAILVERAVRIGLTALQSVGVTLNVDAVRAEFERFADQSRAANERAAEALETVLRANFADGDGRLPRTLETFLGDRGKLKGMVEELFDPKRQDSAVGRIATMLGTYFDGDASRLATLLDPTRLGSPLHQFRSEVADGFRSLQEKLVAIEAAQQARAGERAKSAAKGGDFEAVLEGMLGDIARGASVVLERCGNDAGDA